MKKVLKVVAVVAFLAGILSALKIWGSKKNDPDIFDDEDDEEELWEEE